MPIAYAVYARKSDDDRKVTEKSITDQINEVREFAERAGLTVACVIEESRSARLPGKRPLWADLIRRVRRGEITGILCWHVNRLARNMQEGGELAQLFVDGKLREIRTPFALYKTGDNIVPLVLETGTSAQYSIEVVQNVTRGMRGHFERGGTTHRAPQGYRNARDPDNPKRGIVLRDEPRFTLIRKGFEMLLTGSYTVSQVRRSLNDEMGYRTRGGYPLSVPAVHKLFCNPFYAGFAHHKGKIGPGVHEPMITPAEFEQVTAILDSHRPKKPRSWQREQATGRRYPFTGLMRCASCGQIVTAEFHTLTNGKPHVFYRCSDSWRRCTKRGMNEAMIEDLVGTFLDRITLDAEIARIAADTIGRTLSQKHIQLEAGALQTQDALAATEKRAWRLEDMYLRGLIENEDRYRAHSEALEKERSALVIRGEASRFDLDVAQNSLKNVAAFTVRARDAFDAGDAYTKREIVGALASSYRFFGREKRLEIEVDPVLTGFVTLAQEAVRGSAHRSCQPEIQTASRKDKYLFERGKNGSCSTKESTRAGVLSFGGPSESLIELVQPGNVLPAGFVPGMPEGSALPHHCPLPDERGVDKVAAMMRERDGIEAGDRAYDVILTVMKFIWAVNLHVADWILIQRDKIQSE